MGFKATSIGVVLSLSSVVSYALTLGSVQGNAWIGRRLDVAVALQLQPGLSASTLCAQAEVFYADSKVDTSQVQVVTEPTDRADWVSLRVLSAPPVNEPVVTLHVRAGCESPVTRTFVFLPDVPGETVVQLPQAPTNGSANRSTDAATPSTAQAKQPEGTPPSVAPSKPNPPVMAKRARNPSTAAKGANRGLTTAKPELAPTAPSTGRSRLTLDPLETLVERVKTLESTTQPTQLEELVQTSQHIVRLQTDIKTLLDQAAVNTSNMQALQERLRKAEETRFSNALVYLMAALALLCVLGIVLFWRRSASLIRKLTEERRAQFVEIVPSQQAPDTQPHTTSEAPVVRSNLPVDVDVNWLETDEKGLDDIMQPKPTQPADLSEYPNQDPRTPPPAMGADSAHLDFHSDHVLALLDQAQLFIQLGKIDQATNALEAGIRQKVLECPLLFLEVLRIAHENGQKADYRQFSDEFQLVFNVTVPEFALFKAEGRGLDAHPGLLQHIAKLWPSPEALEVIESCILRSAWGNNSEPFNLAAFKELVHLHGLVLRGEPTPDASAMPAILTAEAETTALDLPL